MQQRTADQTDLLNELRASEERLALALKASGLGLWEWDIVRDKLTWSPQLKKIFGLKATDKVSYKRYQKLIYPDDRKMIQETIEKSMRDGSSYTVEHRTIWPDGSVHWIQGQGKAYLENGKAVYMIGTCMLADERKEAELKIRASEERLSFALKASNMGTWESKLQPGKEIWSKGLKRLVGLKSSDVLTREKFLSIIHPDDRDIWLENIISAQKTGKPYAIEYRVVWPDKSVHWIMGQGQAHLKNGKAIRMVGTTMNIDKRKKFEIELHESEKRFRHMADTAPVFIWLADTKNLGTYFNKPWLEFTGRTMEQELGTGWTESVHPEDLPRAASYCQKCFEKRKEFKMEFRLRKHDGTYHWVLDHGVPRYSSDGTFLGYIGSCLDIDERKKFEIELHESEQRFRSMADAAPVLIWVAGPDKQLTYFNKPWQDFTGRKLEQDLGEGWRDDIHPDDLDFVVKVYYDAVDNREPYTMEYRLRRHDGEFLWMLDKGVPRYSPEGEFLGFIGSMIEIEDLKITKKRKDELEEINRKLQLQREQLMELNNTKDEFISVASHQLRTPATGVKQYIGMLLEGYSGELSERQIKMLQTAYESNERQLRIIDDLLKVAHIDAGKVTLIRIKSDLVDLIEDVIDEQADKFKQKRQGITFKHKNRFVIAAVDPERIRMVLENLIDNASKYSPDGKNVTVELKQTPKRFSVSVTDQGVGIAKKDISQLFRKFSRLENELSTRVGGTGLGLYWVKKMVELHNGDIKVVSRIHKGTTFTISIPKSNN